jgi:ESS family glutamate:Na+ symporter
MEAWQSPFVATALVVGCLLGVGALIERLTRIPGPILAGVLGLVGGPSLLGVLPFDVGVLESGVYHALGLVFVCLGLRERTPGAAADAPSMAFAVSLTVAVQTVLGLGIALGIGAHPGLGLLLPLGFEQGPGQALAIGTAWEASGLVDGGQLGLILAAMGFLWAIVVGVPLALLGVRRGWRTFDGGPTEVPVTAHTAQPLTLSLAHVAVVYSATYALCAGLASLAAGLPDIAAMVWGFHFVLGALLGTGVRAALDRLKVDTGLDDGHLGALSGSVVDAATVAALAAIQLAILTANWWPIVLLSTAGGVATLLLAFGLGWWGFRAAPFEHALLWFGMSTGTLPVGLALLRTIDPDLRSPAPASAVYGMAFAIAGVAPTVLILHPMAVTGRPLEALGLMVVWSAVLVGGWAWWRR